ATVANWQARADAAAPELARAVVNANTRLSRHRHRLAVPAGSAEGLARNLKGWLADEAGSPVIEGTARTKKAARVGFVFSGNGSQWAGMGRYMLLKDNVFRDAFGACNEIAIRFGSESLLELIMSPDLEARLDRAPVAQTLLLAVQMATVDALAARGLRPAAVLGHSAGEVAAAYAAGALTAEEAVRIIVARSATLDQLYGKGTMAAVVCDLETARELIESAGLDVDIAAENSAKSLTVSGNDDDVARLLKLCRKKRIVAKRLQIEYPYHSALTEPLRPRLMEELEGIQGRKTGVAIYSGCKGQAVAGDRLDPHYWWENARNMVRFREGIAAMAADGVHMFLEISPKSVLQSYIRDGLSEGGFTGTVLGSLEQTNADKIDATSIALSVLVEGGELDEAALLGAPVPFGGDLPDYPFERKEHRLASDRQLDLFGTRPHHPVLGGSVSPDTNIWTADLSVSRLPWLADHKVDGKVLVPAMAMLEAFLSAAVKASGHEHFELRNVEILRPIQIGPSELVTVRVTYDKVARRLTLESKVGGGEWAWVAGAAVFQVDAGTPGPITLAAGEVRPDLYASLSAQGLDYGAAFARAGAISVEGENADVHISGQGMEDAGYELDPTAMDAALHALLPMLQAYQSKGQTVFVPGRMGRVRFLARGEIAGARLAVTSGSASGICANVTFVDKTGRVLAEIEELRLRPMPLSRDRAVSRWDERRVPVRSLGVTAAEPEAAALPDEEASDAATDLQVLRDSIGGRLAWDVVTKGGYDGDLDRRYESAVSTLQAMELLDVDEAGEVRLGGACPWPAMETILRLLIETEPDAADEIRATLHGMASDARNDAPGIDRMRAAALALLEAHEGSMARCLLVGKIDPVVFRALLARSDYLVLAAENEEAAEALSLNLAGADQCLVTTLDKAAELPGFDLVVSLAGAEVLRPRAQRKLASLGIEGGRVLLVDYDADLFEIMTGRYAEAGAVEALDANLAPGGVAGTRLAWPGAPNVVSLSAVCAARSVEAVPAVAVTGTGGFAQALQGVPQEGEPSGVVLVALDETRGDRVLAQSDAFRDLPEASVLWVAQQGLEAEAALRGWRRVLANETGRDIRCMSVAEGAEPAEVLRLAATSGERELTVTGAGVFAQRVVAEAEPASEGVEAGQKAVLSQASHGRLDTLHWAAEARTEPGAGEVEIEIAATALNFRDVMWAQGLLPNDLLEGGFAGPSLGMECSGVVVRAGAQSGLEPGQRALAFSRDAFSTHVTVPSEAVIPIPDELDLASAAAIPVIFVTSEYSLTDLARLRAGEWCLIHGGAGGVGLAAIQVAQRAGARIIATAGSEEKRTLLRALGVEHVCDSRNLEFPDFVKGLTGGRGVDVVLNSLAGEAMEQGIGCLAPFGRFIELGKRDFVANTAIGLRALKNNISYFAVDADQLLRHRPEAVKDIMARVTEAFADGSYYLPPVRMFPSGQVDDAFRFMQRSGHIGKILVTPPVLRESAPVAAPGYQGAWLITGGTRGFGLATAEWLAERGASTLWLVSRSGAVEAPERVVAIEARGVRVETRAADLTDKASVEALIEEIGAEGGLNGVVNGAAVIEDAMFEKATPEGLARVISSKLESARLLDTATRSLSPEHFWLYSSVAARFGNPGQSAYVAANLELEALARARKAEGLPALAVAWGPIGDVGYLDRAEGVKEIIERKLGRTMQAGEALDALAEAMADDPARTTVTIAAVDWARLKNDIAVVSEPLFEFMDLRQEPTNAEGVIDLAALLASEGEAKTRGKLVDLLRREAAQIMRIAPAEIDVDRELVDLGFDSLMGMSLKMAMEERMGAATPLTSVAHGMTLSKLAHAIVSGAASGTSESVETSMAERHLTESALPTEVLDEIANAAVGQLKK
ncbi:MAG: SDR family NAD(P)-dependent oxidoreductase, partial [Silicimonas sp.]|nr:SDR family NAD(P)-dependent oxidoreductase [Silicimonas sp.]